MSHEPQHDDLSAIESDQEFHSKWVSVQKKFAVLLDSMADGIIFIDANGKIVLANSQGEKLFGYSNGELVSREIELLVPNRLRADHREQRNSYINNPYPRPMGDGRTLFGLRKDGSEFLAEISLSPMRTNSELLVCAAVRDISSRRNTERILRLVVEGTSLAFGEDYFRSLVRHLANAFEVERAFVSEIHERKFRLLASWNGDDFEENYEYDSAGTPCENVIKEGLVFYPQDIQQFFPKDPWLVENHVESYLAISLLDLEGRPIGLVGVAHNKPLPEVLSTHSVFQAISTRAGAELLRMRADKSLRLANDELEDRVKIRTEELERSNEQLKAESAERQWLTSIYKSSPIGLCCFDKQQRYIDVNEWLAELNGIPIEQHLGRTIQEVIPDVAESVELQLRHVIETGEPIIDGEVIAETPATPQVKKHFLHSYYPLLSDQGDIVGVSCAIQDVTVRKKAEADLAKGKQQLEDRVKERTNELEESNEQYRAETVSRIKAEEDLQTTHEELSNILDSIPNYLWSADIDESNKFTYRYYSPVVEDITGRPPEFFMSGLDAFISTVHPDDRRRLEQAIGRIVSRQSIREEEEYRIVLPDGSIRWVRDNVLVTTLDDDCLRLDGVVGDITDRIAFENAFRASEEQVRLLLDSTVEAIYGLDLQGNCTFCNRACLETLGYSDAEELLGQNMHDLIHHTRTDGSRYPMQECKIFEAFRCGLGTHVDDEVLWKADGSSFPSEYRSIPVRRNGELVGSVVTFLDTTEQKRVEEELRQQQAELNHAARLSTLGEMAAGLAHELNQPLTAMSAFAEGALLRLARGGKFREEEIETLFSRIAEDSQRAGNIIRRLRNFVQKREAQRIQLEVNPLVGDVYQLVESDTKHQDITIQLELANDLPAIVADPIEIQQVLLNLIRNSCDAISQCDSAERRILISSCENNPGRVEVIVEDSGSGISSSMASQVFEPFYTSKSEGLGIGLGICKNIVESHRGTIWLENSSMGGAGVHFDFPSCLQESEIDAL